MTDRLLDLARRGSTTVVLEDLHWADDSSLDLLDYLVRSAREERLLVAVTARSHDPAYETVRDRLGELARLPQVTVVHPRRLSPEDVGRQLETLTGAAPGADVVRRTAERSSGVPFLVEELVAAGAVTDGDALAVEALVGHRVSGLSSDARALVEVAAVGRDPLDDDLLYEASGLSDDGFDAALVESLSAGVLERVGAHEYRFRHALLREVTLHELAPRRSRALHRAWAEALAGHPAGGGPLAAELAEHWSEAGEPAQALAAYVQAANEASRVFAHRERYRLLLAAISAWDRVPEAAASTGVDLGPLLADALELAWTFNDHVMARELIGRGRSTYSAPADRDRQAWFDLYELWLRWGEDRPVPVAETERVVADVRRQPPGRQHARALFTLCNALLQDGRGQAALPVAEEARAMAFSMSDVTVRIEALGHLALVLGGVRDFERAIACTHEALGLAEAIGDLLWIQDCYLTQGLVLWEAGDVRGARLAAERGRDLLGGTRPGPLPRQWAVHTLNAAEGLLDEGRWDDAAVRLDEVLAAADLLTPWVFGWGERLATWLRVVRGDVGTDGLEFGSGRDHEDQRVQDAYVEVATVVDMLVHRRRFDRARAAAATVLWESRIEHAIPAYVWPLLAVTSRLEVEAATAGAAVDGAAVDRLAALALVVPQPNEVLAAHAAQVAADLSWAQGTPDLELSRVAAERWAQAGLPYWQAWALLRAGSLEADDGDKAAARSSLARALTIAGELGAEPLADRVRATAADHGIRLAGRDPGGRPDPVGLTAREHEVLGLLGEGASNRRIAEQLFISEKTVSVHVSNLLAKLGASNRGEAVAAARRLQLLDTPTGG